MAPAAASFAKKDLRVADMIRAPDLGLDLALLYANGRSQ